MDLPPEHVSLELPGSMTGLQVAGIVCHAAMEDGNMPSHEVARSIVRGQRHYFDGEAIVVGRAGWDSASHLCVGAGPRQPWLMLDQVYDRAYIMLTEWPQRGGVHVQQANRFEGIRATLTSFKLLMSKLAEEAYYSGVYPLVIEQ